MADHTEGEGTVPGSDGADEPPSKRRARRTRLQASREQRRRTRGRLLRAGYRLFAERGKDAVSIRDVTQAAGVGFGSFFNHFDSKDALHDALIDAFIDDIDVRVGGPWDASSDEAAVLSRIVRYAVERAGRDTVWRKFLLREAFSGSLKRRGIEARLIAVIEQGLQSGRFHLLDPKVGAIATAAALVGVVSGGVGSQDGPSAPPSSKDIAGLARRASATMLSALGLSPSEARRIANGTTALSKAPVVRGARVRHSDRQLLFFTPRQPSRADAGVADGRPSIEPPFGSDGSE